MKALSLYAGAGGLGEGLIKAGFEIVFANDFDKNACKTYEANHGNHVANLPRSSHTPNLPDRLHLVWITVFYF